jgi:hypothetical protein
MDGKIAVLVIFDILVSIFFIASNLWIWQYVNGQITLNSLSPFQWSMIPQTIIGGKAETIGTFFPLPNYPFILFWIALIGNFILAFLAMRSNNKRKS